MHKEAKERILLSLAVILICVMGFVGICMQNDSLIYILAPVPFIIALLMYLYAKQKTLCQNCGKSFGLKFVDTDTRSAYTISLQKKDSNSRVHTKVFQIGEERDYFICKHCGFISFKTKKFKTQIK
ncbi:MULTISPECIES: hypothetical protein [Helicobacter]|nr:hypothetical protein [Helicobacter sp. MIT 03-1616]TLD86422.1 hypothetical protein LS67_008030 [Helicobacter sp. MIT 03-1616]